MSETIFESTVGDDIAVEVYGDYDKPDRSVGYGGSFQINKVCLKGSSINIESLLNKSTLERLEWQGMDAAIEAEAAKKQDAVDARYEAMRDNKIAGINFLDDAFEKIFGRAA